MVVNEPETSLHPDLVPALARLIAPASEQCQIIIVSHAQLLIQTLEQVNHCRRLHLEKCFGETLLADTTGFKTPRWEWPSR